MTHLQSRRRALLCKTGAAAVLFLAAGLPLRAQNIPQINLGGPMGEMIGKMRQSRSFADPGISNTSNLLTRADVRNELVLNGRQTEALTDLQNGYPAAMAQQMMNMMQQMRSDTGGANPADMTPEDRQQYVQQMRSKVQDTVAVAQGEQDKKAEGVLTPSQTKRLRELDLQWRGPLALADSVTGAKLPLTADQQPKFAALLKEYRDQQQALRGGMFGMGRPIPPAPVNAGVTAKKAAPPAGDPNAPASPPQPELGGRFTLPTPEEMQTQMEEQDKQIVKLRKVVDAKALALLTPAQQQQWKTMQGRPFAFRISP